MRLFILPLALLAATPAAAQIVINGSRQAQDSQQERAGPVQADRGWRSDVRSTHRRTEAARARGEISRRQARAIHREERRLRAAGARFAADGLSEAEREMLESQAFALRDLAQAPNRPVPPTRRGR